MYEENTTVASMVDKQKAAAIAYNRERLVSIVEVITFCARNNLPLRGRRDNEDLKSDKSIARCLRGESGTFRALLAFRIHSGDEKLKEQLKNAPCNASWISPRIQNEIIHQIGRSVQEQIAARLNKAKFFSVLCDETTDESTVEQMTVSARYVDMDALVAREDFLGFVDVTSTTGASLKASLETFLNDLGIDMKNIRGQGYDGESNMAGKFKALQALMIE